MYIYIYIHTCIHTHTDVVSYPLANQVPFWTSGHRGEAPNQTIWTSGKAAVEAVGASKVGEDHH